MAKFGIIHVHSDFSYDGRHTLGEIASFAKNRGYSFVGMTEHSNTFDADKMAAFVKACRRLSDPELFLIPGIEFNCEKDFHLMGLGIECLPDMAIKDPIAVTRFIRGQGGLAIVSHPSRYAYRMPSGLETEIHGIEVWNASYDGRFVPNDQSIEVWQELRKRNTALIAFGGQDLHHITNHSQVKLEVRSSELTEESVLQSLKQGNFTIANSCFRLHPLHPPGQIRQAGITWARQVYAMAKALRAHLGA